MSALMKCTKTPSGNILTAEGRMAYVSFYKAQLPKGETDQAKAKYQGTLVFPKGTDLALLNDAVEQAAVDKWGADYKKKYKVKKPFLKTEDHPKIGLEAEEYPVFVRCSSATKPQVVDAKMVNIGDEKSEAVYSGRWGRYSVRPYTYDHPTGGKGVSLGLQNVQILRDDEPLAAVRVSAEQEFEAIDGVGGEAGGSSDKLFE